MEVEVEALRSTWKSTTEAHGHKNDSLASLEREAASCSVLTELAQRRAKIALAKDNEGTQLAMGQPRPLVEQFTDALDLECAVSSTAHDAGSRSSQ